MRQVFLDEVAAQVKEASGTGRRIKAVGSGHSFTSIAVLDALKMFPGPIVELHISNIHRREELYRHSLVSKAATAVIAGLGARGYGAAVRAIREMVDENEARA